MSCVALGPLNWGLLGFIFFNTRQSNQNYRSCRKFRQWRKTHWLVWNNGFAKRSIPSRQELLLAEALFRDKHVNVIEETIFCMWKIGAYNLKAYNIHCTYNLKQSEYDTIIQHHKTPLNTIFFSIFPRSFVYTFNISPTPSKNTTHVI